jgi:hypothetical protein
MESPSPEIPFTRHTFSRDEDVHLRSLVAEYGITNWRLLASMMPQRSLRQCKERWFHYLSPDLVRRPWTKEEDAFLMAHVLEHGHKWKLFEGAFPGRPETSIKNRFNVLVRRRTRHMRLVMKPIVVGQSPEVPSISTFADSYETWSEEEFDDGAMENI